MNNWDTPIEPLYRGVAVYLDYDDNPAFLTTDPYHKPRDAKGMLTRQLSTRGPVRPPFDRKSGMTYDEWRDLPTKPFRLIERFVEKATGWERANDV